ncbi:hypothetical protein BpHYR1_029533 [Brachionus plicatilis]|uniref:Uncharacterized protein n=1 Tax=Brachionus plicatilis TaxID=10195 RepID=A0A3M7P1S4_BRAPC|nr:hypothetical protein BpHYR1_029533 [Brachionus plicatilis]
MNLSTLTEKDKLVTLCRSNCVTSNRTFFKARQSQYFEPFFLTFVPDRWSKFDFIYVLKRYSINQSSFVLNNDCLLKIVFLTKLTFFIKITQLQNMQKPGYFSNLINLRLFTSYFTFQKISLKKNLNYVNHIFYKIYDILTNSNQFINLLFFKYLIKNHVKVLNFTSVWKTSRRRLLKYKSREYIKRTTSSKRIQEQGQRNQN